jgi:ataxia telangiectasia mutated family protein
MVSTERGIFQKSKSVKKNTAQSRLKLCGVTLRAVVDSCVGRLQIRMTRSVLLHIIKTIPTASGNGFCEPPLLDYVKTMKRILDFQPHVEHLRDAWSAVLKFCLHCLEDHLGQLGEINGGEAASSHRSGRSWSRVEIDEIVSCVKQLWRATNAPGKDDTGRTVSILLQYLEQTGSVSRSHSEALSAVTSVLTRTMHSQIEYTFQALRDILPLLVNLWRKFDSAALKEEVFALLILSRYHISSALRRPEPGIRLSVEQLLEVMQDEHFGLPDRDQLRLEDIRLTLADLQKPLHPFVTPNFRLHTGNLDAEIKWIRLFFISFFSVILDETREEARPVSPDGAAPRKRVRVSNNFNETLRLATLASVPKQISALQTLAFLVTMHVLDSTQLTSTINSLMPLMSHGNGVLASWTMMVLSGCALQVASRDKAASQCWTRVWQFTTRAIPSQATSRAASWLGSVILSLELVPYSALAENIEHMQARPDLAGPAVLAESSIAFWLSAARLINSESTSSSQGASEKILGWVFRKWFPSKFQYFFRLRLSSYPFCRLIR